MKFFVALFLVFNLFFTRFSCGAGMSFAKGSVDLNEKIAEIEDSKESADKTAGKIDKTREIDKKNERVGNNKDTKKGEIQENKKNNRNKENEKIKENKKDKEGKKNRENEENKGYENNKYNRDGRENRESRGVGEGRDAGKTREIKEVINDVLKSTISIEAVKLEGVVDKKSSYYVLKKFGNIIETGAGFLISEDGYVITNNHVVKDADKIIITANGKEYQADLVGDDEYLDVALLKIKNGNGKFPFLELKSDVDMDVGDRIIIVGNPYNLGLSVSTGIISALHRNIKDTGYNDLIQTDANINKGNSGGPIFNENGDVIGVNSIIFSPEDGRNVGISFAIPIKNIIEIIDKMKKYGYIQRGWIGINGKDSTEDIFRILNSKRESGVLVESVVDNSPAERAGIRPADIIVSYNGKKVKNLNDLLIRVRNSGVDNSASILILRNGKYIKYRVNVEELPNGENYELNEMIALNSTRVMDMVLTQIDKGLVDKYKLYNGYINNGMYVLKVDEGGIADKNGIEKGDIVLSINQVQLKTKNVLDNAINNLENSGRNEVIVVVKKYRSLENVILRMKLRNY